MELVASRPVVEGEVRRALRALARQPGNKRNRVVLLRAAAQWRDEATEFSLDVEGRQVLVTVAACPTVLAVLDAMSAPRPDDGYLVVLTPVDEHEVGDTVLSRAIQPVIKPIDRWDLVQDAFGATRLDPLLTRSPNNWVAEALLDAQPAGGWRRLTGTVLTWSTALNRLAATRLGIEEADDSPADAATLLTWTTDAPAVASFLTLRKEEQDGIIGWVGETAGDVARVVFAMADAGKIPDAVPFGLVAAALYGPDTDLSTDPATVTARVRAEERYFAGRAPDAKALGAFGEAAESLVTRWADNGHAPQAMALCERAERILAELSGGDPGSLAGRSRVLDAGLDARLARLGKSLTAALAKPGARLTLGSLDASEHALQQVRDHGRARDRDAEIRAAEAAVRLARWLAVPEEAPATLADAATRMLRSWGWADRCLVVLDRADTSRVPSLHPVYEKIWTLARARRASLDVAFAVKLASWTETGSDSDLIAVENLLERVARPVADKCLPIIIVLDGMSVAVASELAEEIAARGTWLEASRRSDGREPALATVPSVTAISRASLLTGTLTSGGQDQERSGFAAFWGRTRAVVFHKADLAPESAAKPLADRVRDEILDTGTVVAIVLNTIDDTLDKGKHGPAHWGINVVDYLGPVLEEARRAGRPVILTADHGHVLERGHAGGIHPASTAQSESARYRVGSPAAGEIIIRGPRVLDTSGNPGDEVVAAVDEAIHYTPKKAGYHGGAAAAEVVIPVITMFPSVSLLPDGWHDCSLLRHSPAWWESRPVRKPQLAPSPQPAATSKPPRPQSRTPKPSDDSGTLFATSEIAPVPEALATSLGSQIAASPRMAAQRQFVRRAPDEAKIAALIDALVAAGGRLTIPEAAAVVGEPPVRLTSGYLATVTRILNVDGYAILQTTDNGRAVELNQQLLRQQFAGE
jgi:hypothetical protein